MYFLIAIVVILMVMTYSVDSRRSIPKEKRKPKINNPFQGRFKARDAEPGRHHTIDRGELMRCHQCGTFFSPKKVVKAVVEGHILEFCSENCRNHFVDPH